MDHYENTSSTTKNKLGWFFTNDIIFTICVVAIIALAGFTLYKNVVAIFADISGGPYESAGTKLIIIISTMVLFIGYLNNNKNAMQSMMGALLSLLVIKSVPMAIKVLLYKQFEGVFVWYNLYVLTVTVGFLILFVNHQLINRLYISSPGKVFFNEIVAMLLTLGFIALAALYLSIGRDVSILASLGMYVLVADSVVFAEANMDYARLLREGH